VYIKYTLLSGSGSVRLRVRPSVHFRPHESSVASKLDGYTVTAVGDGFEIHCPTLQVPPLRCRFDARPSAMILDGGRVRDLFYRVEHARGYDALGTVWSPGYFRTDLRPGEEATLVASTESCDVMTAIKPGEAFDAEAQRRWRLIEKAHPAAQEGTAAELVLAADQFIITPATRVADAARSRAAGDQVRTVIAGYHWFTDWGRDTMISLDGLTLATGRQMEAGYILRSYAHHVRDGLIPNLFPEGEREGLYHTADATLWYFHAIDRYLRATGDTATLRLLWPTLRKIVDHHLQGTRFGIHVDPRDGLLSQGEAGYQLTWMDAKVDNWVVTPRRGKPVEINALWYNALRLMEHWAQTELNDGSAEFFAEQAERALVSFNQRFWYAAGSYLYDVVDGEQGDDPSMRPNQVLAISLPHPVLDRSRWDDVMARVEERLLTPLGLRSLAPGEPDYKSRYDGDLRSRDAAYHQGTVWSWLIGPFIDAWLKLHPGEFARARTFLTGFRPHLGEACIGSISEIFDAAEPFTARGCVAQAWSVAEALRCWVKTAEAPAS
jgi:predicted glycogen debranching enzyme